MSESHIKFREVPRDYRTEIPNIVFELLENGIISPNDFNVYSKLKCSLDRDRSSLEVMSIEKTCHISNKTAAKSLKNLINLGLVEKLEYEEEGVVELLKSKPSNKLENTSYAHVQICEWCKSETYCLSQHHYPTRKKDLGVDVVNICANCHQEFHFLCDYPKYSITKAGE